MDSPPPAIIQRTVISQQDKEIVAACLIGEAGGEGLRGMQAVLNVVVNRAKKKPQSFVKVVTAPKQFSTFNGIRPSTRVSRSKAHPCWAQAMMLVNQAVAGHLTDITSGSTHYHETTIRPGWSRRLSFHGRIGNHLFYRRSA